jgi:hypothetical protein
MPSWLQADGVPGFVAFWDAMVTTGPWPSGPAWFVGMLLIFDAASALVFVSLRRKRSDSVASKAWTPLLCFAAFLACLAFAYLPFLGLFGPSRWVSLGPLAIQESRIGLYAACFAAGVAVGPGLLASRAAWYRESLAGYWGRWAGLAVFTGAILVGTRLARAQSAAGLPAWTWLGLYSVVFASFCAAACFAHRLDPWQRQWLRSASRFC